ncbi:MAG: sugar transferase [Clostridia bacterium]|nr:sugar transferase [Clostridia bacterium]
MNSKSKLQTILLFLADLLSITVAVPLALYLLLWRYHSIEAQSSDILFLGFVAASSFLVSFFVTNTKRDISNYSVRRFILNRLAATLILFASFTILIVSAKSVWSAYRLYLGMTALLYGLLSLLLRALVHRWLIKNYRKTRSALLTGIVTTADRAEEITKALNYHWSRRLVGIALLDGKGELPDEINGVPVKADADNFMDWLRLESLDEIFVDIPYENGNELIPLLEQMQSMGVVVHLNVNFYDQIREDRKLHLRPMLMTVRGKPMLTFAAAQHNQFALIIKRVFDFLIGLVGSILSLPIILIVAIPLLIESPGPLIFSQKRVGKNGRVFKIYKLRSMYRDAEARKAELMEKNQMSGHMFKMKDDPRITKVGKFIRRTSIDELPQFWNILRGDMSFVGTRPPTVEEYEQYDSHHKRRLSLKPGLTGLWQVSGRSDITDFEDVVKLDCSYIDNWSLWLDFKIILKTIPVVFGNRGAE